MTMEPNVQSSPDLVWGISGIARIIDRTDRQTHYMLSSGLIPARKVGGRWVAERGKLMAFFLEDAQ